MNRRTLLVGGAGTGALALLCGGGALFTGPGTANATIAASLATLDAFDPATLAFTGAWNTGQVLVHLAQSVEYSMTGYPEPKSAVFQRTAGCAAFTAFSTRGQMRHGLADPIPGAPDLPANPDVPAAMKRLRDALVAFDGHTGELAPHFAYGALSHRDYEIAHALHLQDHLRELA